MKIIKSTTQIKIQSTSKSWITLVIDQNNNVIAKVKEYSYNKLKR